MGFKRDKKNCGGKEMNWLMYLGGGVMWFIFNLVLGAVMINYDDKKYEAQIRWIYLISSLLVWIWICWRFIK